MKKELTDYLYLYVGCEMYSVPQQGEYFIEQLTGVDIDCIRVEGNVEHPPYDFMPILRPLSDMTEKEQEEYDEIVDFQNKFCSDERGLKIECEAEKTKFLLSKHFDLFGLIEAGLAIDKTTLNK